MTGFYRDGCCNTGPDDEGLHTICCHVTAAFLAHQKHIGNDLSTPFPAFGFPGLRPGDRWCVCISRWKESLEAGIAAMISGNRLTDVAHAIEQGTRSAEARYGRPFGIVEGYGGHGIGRHMHMDPFLPNEGSPGRGPLLAPGSVLAIEPMLTLGSGKTLVLDDEWTVTTTDASHAAHWEHTVAVTENGPRILTVA